MNIEKATSFRMWLFYYVDDVRLEYIGDTEGENWPVKF